MDKQEIINKLKEITVDQIAKEPKERSWHFDLERLIDKLEMNDDDLSFDVDLPNKFKIEVTQNHEGSKWYLCAYDNNGDHFSSYDCQNEKGVLAMISVVSQDEMRE